MGHMKRKIDPYGPSLFISALDPNNAAEALLVAGIIMSVLADLPSGNADMLTSIVGVVGPVAATAGLVVGMVNSLLRNWPGDCPVQTSLPPIHTTISAVSLVSGHEPLGDHLNERLRKRTNLRVLFKGKRMFENIQIVFVENDPQTLVLA